MAKAESNNGLTLVFIRAATYADRLSRVDAVAGQLAQSGFRPEKVFSNLHALSRTSANTAQRRFALSNGNRIPPLVTSRLLDPFALNAVSLKGLLEGFNGAAALIVTDQSNIEAVTRFMPGRGDQPIFEGDALVLHPETPAKGWQDVGRMRVAQRLSPSRGL